MGSIDREVATVLGEGEGSVFGSWDGPQGSWNDELAQTLP